MAEIISIGTNRPVTTNRIRVLADLMDMLAPDAHGIGPEDALTLLAQCGDDVDLAVRRLMAVEGSGSRAVDQEHDAHLRAYLLRRGLMSVVGDVG